MEKKLYERKKQFEQTLKDLNEIKTRVDKLEDAKRTLSNLIHLNIVIENEKLMNINKSLSSDKEQFAIKIYRLERHESELSCKIASLECQKPSPSSIISTIKTLSTKEKGLLKKLLTSSFPLQNPSSRASTPLRSQVTSPKPCSPSLLPIDSSRNLPSLSHLSAKSEASGQKKGANKAVDGKMSPRQRHSSIHVWENKEKMNRDLYEEEIDRERVRIDKDHVGEKSERSEMSEESVRLDEKKVGDVGEGIWDKEEGKKGDNEVDKVDEREKVRDWNGSSDKRNDADDKGDDKRNFRKESKIDVGPFNRNSSDNEGDFKIENRLDEEEEKDDKQIVAINTLQPVSSGKGNFTKVQDHRKKSKYFGGDDEFAVFRKMATSIVDKSWVQSKISFIVLMTSFLERLNTIPTMIIQIFPTPLNEAQIVAIWKEKKSK
jgi:hypothetical protein